MGRTSKVDCALEMVELLNSSTTAEVGFHKRKKFYEKSTHETALSTKKTASLKITWFPFTNSQLRGGNQPLCCADMMALKSPKNIIWESW